MKRFIFFISLFFTTVSLSAQGVGIKFSSLDKSPMDMIYYPVNYPVLRIQPNKTVPPLVARVIYSRPQKHGRKVFGDLVEDGQVWRLGANEATEIEFFSEVNIGNARIKKGRYTLYALESKDRWTIILNKETDIWGAFKYDAAKDVVRVECKVSSPAETLEAFSMVFEKVSEKSFQLVMGWENAQVALPISIL